LGASFETPEILRHGYQVDQGIPSLPTVGEGRNVHMPSKGVVNLAERLTQFAADNEVWV
jgi:hypothetical protein